ncbi:flagellar basal body L-ring protein FlgH [Polycladidibacter hongkongensis]|uniref:flagellar basal body L-ring protein FlgH n=1 Tax=Polycladidibacter hongkongensis TaxID=1647556 RepID=UPI000A64BB2A|nr:flagellar basal body L-ring protein FlgH [Pseudovibrio hongkongensis]
MKPLATLVLALSLASCTSMIREIGQEPSLTPLGHGLSPKVANSTIAVPNQGSHKKRSFHGLWAQGDQAFFKDSRASSVGDVVTVAISIDDKATLDNESTRSRDSKLTNSIGGSFSWGTSSTGEAKASLNGAGNSTSKGTGKIDRSEKINLSIAAVVTRVLPNGNLIISGQQEVRVNYEVRVLSVAGIVRPQDITGRNTIAYDKIAEARVSYGGRGRVTELQQPSLGQQVLDKITPF